MLDNRTLATVRTYAQLISVLRARSDELEITRETPRPRASFPTVSAADCSPASPLGVSAYGHRSAPSWECSGLRLWWSKTSGR
jgi:hypothetical protein